MMTGKKRDYTSYVGRSLKDLLILGMLQDEEYLSGYLIIKKIRKISDGVIKFRAGTIYPRIEKLHEKGLLDKKVEDQSSESSDTVRETSTYTLNKSGLNRLQLMAEEWFFLHDKITRILPNKEELI